MTRPAPQAWFLPEVRAQLRLALPVVVIQLGLMAMGTVDSIFMGRVSAEGFAAVTLGHAYTFFWIAFGMGVVSALDPLVSQAFGARDHVAIRRALQRGIVLALLLSVPTALAFLPAGAVFARFGQPDAVVPIAADYCLVSMAGVPAFLVFLAFRQALQAMHRLRPIVLVILATNVLNALLDWVLIFGKLGAPRLEAVGSAWATAASRWCMALLLPVAAWPVLADYLRARDPRVHLLRPLLRTFLIGLPIGLQFLVEVGAFATTALLMGMLGAQEVAGHQVALSLAALTFMVPLGISMAAAVRVGNAVGRGDSPGVRRSSAVSLALGAGVMALFGAVFLSFPVPLARIFTDLPEVLAVAVVLIPLAGIFQVFDGTQVVATGVLRGTADTRVPALVHVLGFWGVGIPLAWLLAFRLDLGPRGLWWGLVAGLASTAVAQCLRVRFRLRGEVARVEIDTEGGETSGAGPPPVGHP